MAVKSEAPRSEELVFQQVSRDPTLSDRVAAEITEAVTSGRILPGEKLHSERELADEFGVSRTVIREAIRSLSAHGLVESRSGRGVQVATVSPDAVNRSMSLFVHGHSDIDYQKVHAVRSALEVEVAGLAAEQRTEEDVGRLSESLEAMKSAAGDLDLLARLDVDFHRAVAAATHNELFVVMLGSIDDLMLEIRRTALAEPAVAVYAIRAHGEILDAVKRHAPEDAREAMRTHLDVAEQAWTAGGAAVSMAKRRRVRPK